MPAENILMGFECDIRTKKTGMMKRNKMVTQGLSVDFIGTGII